MEKEALPGGEEETMTPAPSTPVPAVEAELSNEELLEQFRAIVLMHHAAGTRPKRYVDTARAAVLARMSTTTSGRAAEPDTMGEVEKLLAGVTDIVFSDGATDADGSDDDVKTWVQVRRSTAVAMLLSAVRTIVTERDRARADAERAEAERDELRDAPWPKWVTDCLTIIRKHSGYDGYDDAVQGVDLPAELEETLNESVTRAETAEAQLATRGWQDISTAPKDGTVIWVYAPAYDGLDAITSICAWHEDAGFCIDELRSPTHWQPLNAPTAPATEADL
jgi:hypothetical protein